MMIILIIIKRNILDALYGGNKRNKTTFIKRNCEQ